MINFIDELPLFIPPKTLGEAEAELLTYNLMRKSLEVRGQPSTTRHQRPRKDRYTMEFNKVSEEEWQLIIAVRESKELLGEVLRILKEDKGDDLL